MYQGDFYVSDTGEVTINASCTSSPTLSITPTLSPAPSASPTTPRTCFDLEIYCWLCAEGKYHDKPLATFRVTDSQGRVFATSDLTSKNPKVTYEGESTELRLSYDLCFFDGFETNECYGLAVASNMSGPERERLTWSLDSFESNVVPFSGAFFVGDDGSLAHGCSAPVPTSETPVPSYSGERTFIMEETCLADEDCLLTFDMSEIEVSSKAFLTLDVDGPFDAAYKVAGVFILNTTFFATCSGDYCAQTTCLENIDVTDFLSPQRKTMTVSIFSDFLLEDQSCPEEDTWPYSMRIQATMKVTIISDDEKGPGNPRNISSSGKKHSRSFLFSDLERDLLEEEKIMTFERHGVVYFDYPLQLVSMSRSITGNVTFDGAMRSSFFSLFEGANLSLSDLSLQHGRTQSLGGCIDARRGSRLTLFRVVVENCVAKAFGGAFAFLDASVLLASESKFLRNAAPVGGVACVSLSSSVTLFDFLALQASIVVVDARSRRLPLRVELRDEYRNHLRF